MPKAIDISDLDDRDMIVVHEVTENEDGSANIQLDLGANAVRFLIELGFCTLLKKAIKLGGENGEAEA